MHKIFCYLIIFIAGYYNIIYIYMLKLNVYHGVIVFESAQMIISDVNSGDGGGGVCCVEKRDRGRRKPTRQYNNI